MQINLPDDAVPQIAAKAKAAGFTDVESYALNLVLPTQAPVGSRVAIDEALDISFANGVSETSIKAFLGELRQKLQAAD